MYLQEWKVQIEQTAFFLVKYKPPLFKGDHLFQHDKSQLFDSK